MAELIKRTIHKEELKQSFESLWPGCKRASPYIRKLVKVIVESFPHKLQVYELADRLHIKRSWLLKLCIKIFKISPTRVMRRIWVYQALRLMQRTNNDNGDIALYLDYSDESSMARDFRKELGCCPNEARKELLNHSPEELLS